MRDTIWKWVRMNLQEGALLPWWALTVRAILFPLDFFYWKMSKASGYQAETDTWKINGVIYSSFALHLLSKSQGETYRITRTGRTVTLERVSD